MGGKRCIRDRVNAAREKVRAPLSHLYEGVRGTGDVEGKVTALYNYLTEIALPEELQRQTETLWPVSYTHLDVYKRQARSSGSPCG